MGFARNGDGAFSVVVNHEFTPPEGIARDHGAPGSFISELRIDKSTLQVLEGKDLIEDVHVFNPATGGWSDTSVPQETFNWFCSAELAKPSAFYNRLTRKGYDGGRIVLNGAEASPDRKAFAHIVSDAQAGNI